MPKEAQSQKPPKCKEIPRKMPEDPKARGVAIMRVATGQDVGDTGAVVQFVTGVEGVRARR